MNPRHSDPCLTLGETNEALRRVANGVDEIRNEVERVLTGAHDGACSIHQALWATDLSRDLLAIAGMLGAVEAATVQARASAAPVAMEAA